MKYVQNFICTSIVMLIIHSLFNFYFLSFVIWFIMSNYIFCYIDNIFIWTTKTNYGVIIYLQYYDINLFVLHNSFYKIFYDCAPIRKIEVKQIASATFFNDGHVIYDDGTIRHFHSDRRQRKLGLWSIARFSLKFS